MTKTLRKVPNSTKDTIKFELARRESKQNSLAEKAADFDVCRFKRLAVGRWPWNTRKIIPIKLAAEYLLESGYLSSETNRAGRALEYIENIKKEKLNYKTWNGEKTLSIHPSPGVKGYYEISVK